MARLVLVIAVVAGVALATVWTGRVVARSAAAPVAGTWRSLPTAPIAVDGPARSVSAGRQVLIFGRTRLAPDAQFPIGKAVNVAAVYDTITNRWRRLTPPPGPTGSYEGRLSTVWTGSEMLVWGPFTHLAFSLAANRWKTIPRSPLVGHDAAGVVVWTGREMIGWGGGCCGDAFSDGAAYNPSTNSWRKLAHSPLAGSQSPVGAWTGRELVIVVAGVDPDGKPWPARLARAAAYNPATDTWRRIATLPRQRGGATATWDGHEVLVVGGSGRSRGGRPGAPTAVGFAYDPRANRWRWLPAMRSGRMRGTAAWTGRQLLMWGGQAKLGGEGVFPAHGFAYDPAANRWAPLPSDPLSGRVDPAGVWTGHSMVIWGGASLDGKPFADGAVFTPTQS